MVEEKKRKASEKKKVFTCDEWYGCDPASENESRSSKSIMERASSPESPCAAGRRILLKLYVLAEMRGEIEALEGGVAKDVADGDGDVDA